MRMTKIVCTIGPASNTPERIEQLLRAGMNVARLNFSHGDLQEKLAVIRLIRDRAARWHVPVAILQDLAGPKIRVGVIPSAPVELKSGQTFTLTGRRVKGDAREVSVTYPRLARDVKPGDTILLSDGALELMVKEVRGPDIHCRVVVGGPLGSHKGINVPGRTISAAILTAKDKRDLAFGLEQGVDYVALSFVRTPEDVQVVRRFMKRVRRFAPIIAKIEKHEAVTNIERILDGVDGVMVARGDLGVEIPIENVPRVQKMVIQKANRAGKPVITATQMLKSMVDSPRPTRAEVTDIANAVADGTDAVMLSEETAMGRYPVQAVQVMGRVLRAAEMDFPYRFWTGKFDQDEPIRPQMAVAQAACRLAEAIGAAAIITCTKSGSTTRMVSRYRPSQPILAMTPDEQTYRQMSLVWGATAIMMRPVWTVEAIEREALRLAVVEARVRPGQMVVLTAGLPLNVPGTTNMVKVLTV